VHLRKPAGLRPSRFEELRDRRSGDVLLQDALLRDIRRQQPRHRDAELPQRFIVAELRLQLVAEGVVFAGLVVDLLQDILRGPIRHKIGISALSLSQEPEHGIFRAVYGPCVRHGSGACPA